MVTYDVQNLENIFWPALHHPSLQHALFLHLDTSRLNHYQRHVIPKESSGLGGISHIMLESHMWLDTEPVGN